MIFHVQMFEIEQRKLSPNKPRCDFFFFGVNKTEKVIMDGKIIEATELVTKAPEVGWRFAFPLVMMMEVRQTHRLVVVMLHLFSHY